MNSNGMISLAQTNHQPNNLSEWMLNLVLQRANLVQYFDTFISQGKNSFFAFDEVLGEIAKFNI